MSPARLRCAGCGASPGETSPAPWACPERGRDGRDHVLERLLPPEEGWPEGPSVWGASPYQRWARRHYAWHRAGAEGLGEAFYGETLARLEEAVREVDEGRAFRTAPLLDASAVAGLYGLPSRAVLLKEETTSVAGSHKARHLMGVLLTLEVLRAAGKLPARPRLAIASCGNAALAAATLAAAARLPLSVFVPEHADPEILRRLTHLGAEVERCPRPPGQAGDPSVLRFREAVADGALPFSCQGPDNGLSVEGAVALGYEVAEAIAERVAAGEAPPDRLFVQVGGGALGSALAQGLLEAHAAGRLPKVPRLHTVQTRGGWPLARAYARVVARAEGVVAGLALLPAICSAFSRRLDENLSCEPAAASADAVRDGDLVNAGATIARLRGPKSAVLATERTLLNFLGRMCGVATLTRRYVAAARRDNPHVAVLDTRKTIPGWRELDKYAVCCGGGENHRRGLYDAVLIKDNH
ncbi:MAG: pyridoxal-phosphate dependent enzyme, partial [Deltaproteobacteria bacterium]